MCVIKQLIQHCWKYMYMYNFPEYGVKIYVLEVALSVYNLTQIAACLYRPLPWSLRTENLNVFYKSEPLVTATNGLRQIRLPGPSNMIPAY